MKLLDIPEALKEKPAGRRFNLFITPNLQTWLLYFPSGDVQRMHNHPSDRTYYVVSGRTVS